MVAETLAWWLVLEAVGLIALPIALVLFQRLPSSGIAFAKPLGLLLGGYLFWLALTAHLLPNRPGSVVWVFLLLILVDYLLLRRRWRETLALLDSKAGLILAIEIVFTAGFMIATHIRSYLPEIAATEKPMDFMFLNAVDHSRYYPPEDPWFAGFHVSYYYFGYLIQAMVGQLAAVKTSVAFNLGLTSTAALAATAAFGLGYDLVSVLRRVSFQTAVAVGVTAAIFVTVLGNLEGAVEFGVANGAVPDSVVQKLDVANLETAQQSDTCLVPVVCIKYPTEKSSFIWWWRATRISPDASSITEFPFFSFILGDLHPHVMAIPYVLTVFALGLSLWRSETPLRFETWRQRPLLLLLSAVLLGGLGFLNTWDLPTLGFLLALLVLLRNLAGRVEGSATKETLGFMAPLGVLAVMLYAPFYLSFGSQAQGIAAVQDEATRPLHSILFWGPLIAVSLPLPLLRLLDDREAWSLRRVYFAACLPLALLVLWMLLIFVRVESVSDAVSARGWDWLTALFYAGALVVCVLALWRSIESPDEDGDAMTPVLAAMTVAVLLILGAELFYVRDLFGSRLNTVFKLYYQAWLLLGVAGAVSAWQLMARLPAGATGRIVRSSAIGLAALCLAAAVLYPISATLSRTQGLSAPGRTLDGTRFEDKANHDEYLAIDWLRLHSDHGERIIEANGDSYSDGARVSASTGLPTVLGWPGHELQWSRSAEQVTKRRDDVKRVYESASLDDAMPILRKYGVTYVFVGIVERNTYPAGLQKFENGLESVFHSGDVAIYRLPPEEPSTSP